MSKPIHFSKNFKKAYKKRIRLNPKLINATNKAIELFQKDRKNEDLKDHQLKGRLKQYRSFSVKFDLRIKYEETKEYYKFVDIGTHNQVY